MSNEYIVVNTKKDNKAIWSTIASTYTPSIGEVCIIVPTINSLEEHKDDFNKATVGIKIGDGETVFKDLPLLTDVSSIRPDWDETDTSSPNYIWHKPISNSSLIVSSEIMDLVLSDKVLSEVIDNPTIKTFHHDEYYFIQRLEDDNCFTHPYDLLTEEDDTWGHYDIKYNVNEINHQPKYFYKSNILTNTQFLKYSEGDEGYEYRIEELLTNIAKNIFDIRVEYRKIFNDYNDEDEVSDRILILVTKIANYLGQHNCKIEHQTLYDIINETFYNCNNSSLKLQFSGSMYEKMFDTENINLINKLIDQSSKTYYEINNEIIIDTATNSLYIRKLRLDHYYQEAHGIQEITEILEGSKESPIYNIQIPFEITEEILKNDLFTIQITAEDEIKRIEVTKEEPISSFIYPYSYSVDKEAVADILNAIQENQNAFNQSVNGLDPESEEYKQLLYDFNEMDIYLNNYLHKLKYYEIQSTDMRVKIEDELRYQPISIEEGYTFPVNSLTLPEDFLTDFKITDNYVLGVIPYAYQWEKEYSNLNTNPLYEIPYNEDLDISTHINNTEIKVVYKDINLGYNNLKLKEDYYVDKEKNKIVLKNAIDLDCVIYFNINYEKTFLSKDDYDIEVTESNQVEFILKKPIEQESLISYKRVGKEYNLQYNDEYASGYYTISEDGNNRIINLQTPITKNAIITIAKNYDNNFSLTKDNYDKNTNIVTLSKPITTKAIICYRKNSNTGGYLEIVFHYRLRELNSRYLSNLRPDWRTNSESDINYIRNRPLWIDERDDGLQIVMESGTLPNNIYSNGEVHYYEFFRKMIAQVLGFFDFDADIAELDRRLSDAEAWIAQHKYWFENWVVEGYEDYGKGLIEIIESILAHLRNLQQQLENKTEIYIGTATPVDDPKLLKKYKLWVNTNPENGNGLVYYKYNNSWIPISALWSSSSTEDAL